LGNANIIMEMRNDGLGHGRDSVIGDCARCGKAAYRLDVTSSNPPLAGAKVGQL
jgi:hypothetical protein